MEHLKNNFPIGLGKFLIKQGKLFFFHSYAILANDISEICRPVQEIKVTVHPLPNFTLAQTNVTCNGNANGTITITATSGTSPYEYSIDDGATYSTPTSSTTKLYNNLPPNNYKPTVRDSYGCVKKCN